MRLAGFFLPHIFSIAERYRKYIPPEPRTFASSLRAQKFRSNPELDHNKQKEAEKNQLLFIYAPGRIRTHNG